MDEEKNPGIGISFIYFEHAENHATVPKFGNVDYHGAINLNNGEGYVPIIPDVIDSDRDVNAGNAQLPSSPTFVSRGRDVEHAEEATVSESIPETQEVIDN